MFDMQKIGNRLYFAFAALIFLQFVAAFISFGQFREIQALSTNVAQDRWPKTVIANKIIDNVNANGKSVLALMFLSNSDDMKKSVAQMSEASKELTGFYEQLDKIMLDEPGKVLLSKIKQARTEYVGNRKKAIDLALKGGVEQAKEMLINETIPLQKVYLKTIYELIDRQGSAMEGAVTHIEQIVYHSIILGAGIGLFSLLAAIAMVILLTRSITRPLSHAVKIAQSVAGGKLDNVINITASGETGELLATLKQMQNALREMIGKARAAANRVADAALELVTTVQQVASSAQSQSQATAAAAAAIEELTVSIEQVADNAREASLQADGAGQLANEGSQAVESATAHIIMVGEGVDNSASHIEKLSTEVGRIGNIAVVIKEVADQTNLLALNAAIEAARAGEQGRGFAVVADEVRKLAERTTKSVHEITSVITVIQNETKTAVESMLGNRDLASNVVASSAGATGSMAHLSSTTDMIVNAIRDLSSALNEQRTAASDLAQNIESIAQMSEENTATVDTVAGTARNLEATASDLRLAVSLFKM
jgi:methyl-accepting chemotaxis protein